MSTLQEILMKKYELEDGDILLDDIYVPPKVAVNHLNTLVSEVNSLQKENEELKKDLEWAIDELDGFIANDDCPYYLENIKSIKDKWFKGEEK